MAIKRKLNLGFGSDLDSVNLSALPPQAAGQNGGIIEVNEKRWQMAQLVDAGPSVAGDLGYLPLSGTTLVYGQATRTIGNSTANLCAGVFTTAVTLNYYTLLRQGGAFDVKSEASLDGLGDLAMPNAANNSAYGVNTVVAPTDRVIGFGLAARNGGTGKTLIALHMQPW